MALIIPGNTTTNVFTGDNFNPNGTTKYAAMISASVNQSDYGNRIFKHSDTWHAYIEFSSSGNINAKIRTSSQNDVYTLVTGYSADTQYDIFIKCDLDAGELKFFVNGSQVGTTVDVTGDNFWNVSGGFTVIGDTVDGYDATVKEIAYWDDSAPSDANIANYGPALGLESFDTPPSSYYAPTGDGSTYVSSVSDEIGIDDLAHTQGPTATDNFPYANSSSYSDIIIENIAWDPPTGWDWVAFTGTTMTLPIDSIMYYDGGTHDGSNNAGTLLDSTKAWTTDEFVGLKINNTTDGGSAEIESNAATRINSIRGTHDGSSNVATLSDSTASWTTDEFVGDTVYNLTDGSNGTITANTATTVTATLSGGTDNDWDASDSYAITTAVMAGGSENDWDTGDTYTITTDIDAPDQIVYETTTDNSGTVALDTSGVPAITGASGSHGFDVKFRDVTDSKVSATESITVTV